MAFIRKIRKRSGTYLAKVESYREGGKIKQRVIQYLGKEIDGKPVRRVQTSKIGAESVKRYGDVLAIHTLSKELGLPGILDKHAKEILLLTYSHLLDKVSISRIEGWMKDTELPEILGIYNISTKSLYKALTSLSETDFAAVEEELYEKLKPYDKGNKTLVIDVTDTYFEGKNGSSSKRRRGKDGKRKHLLQICLAVTLDYGFPVAHKIYGGNISNKKLFVDMATELRARGFTSIIIDRGMYSNPNIDSLLSLGIKGVVGVQKTERLVRKFLKKINRDHIYSRKNRIVLKNTKVYALSFPHKKGKLIAVYNPELEVVRREMHYEKGGDDESAQYLGYTLLYHNTPLGVATVVKKYFEKDIVERAFKHIKGILSVRPIRVWMKEHVEGHVRVCYLSYALLSLFGYKINDIDIGLGEALEKLKTCYSIHLKDNESGFMWESFVTLEKIQEEILDKVGVVYKK